MCSQQQILGTQFNFRPRFSRGFLGLPIGMPENRNKFLEFSTYENSCTYFNSLQHQLKQTSEAANI